MNDLHFKCLQALKRCTAIGKPWYVFENCQHPCYRLHPDQMPDHIEHWPIEILPCGDPCYLLSSDSLSGIIAVLRHSITVFGSSLLSCINKDLPVAFTRVTHSTDP